MSALTETKPPSADVDPWMHAMRHGNWEAAWKVCDEVMAARRGKTCFDWPRHLQYVWDGTPLDGRRVLIRCYHGLGDTLMFVRYAPLVKRIAREVIVWAQPAMIPLLRAVHGIDRLLPLHDGAVEADYDVDVEVMELPHVFRTTLATVPEGVILPRWNPRAGRDGVLDVGIVWQAGGWNNERRCVPLEVLAPLFEMEGVRWHVVQRGEALREWKHPAGIIDGSDRPEEAAERIRSLDTMITIDSFPVHLAGAAGVPTWVLLHHHADWRWMVGRDDSPWYPSARLFRQPRFGDWAAVVDNVRRALSALRERSARENPTATSVSACGSSG